MSIKRPALTPQAMEYLRDPRVLLCAWEKVQDWYKNELRPEPEFSEWAANPFAHLTALAEDIVKGRYAPAPFPLIPYPKKGGEIRHYSQPTVRDQVAFVIFGVLLAPLFEVRFHRSSYGNRWFRGISLKAVAPGIKPLWSPNYFRLSDRNLNLSYSRSYGLFRRVANWRAQNILGGHALGDGKWKEEDFAPTFLAYHRVKFRAPERLNGEKAIYYCRLDLSKAYPSVARGELSRKAFELLESSPVDRQEISNSFHPQSVWASLESEPEKRTARSLLSLWIWMLNETQYEPGPVGGSWLAEPDAKASTQMRQQHQRLLSGLAENRFGLPTGLAVSGLLFNILLTDFDRAAERYFRDRASGEYQGVALRFVDDIILLGTSRRALAGAISHVRDYFHVSNSNLGLVISWEKARPSKLGEAMAVSPELSSTGNDEFWEEARITSRSPKDFVTDLVEQLSELGNETVDDLLGSHGQTRLQQLHDLINVPRDDNEVKHDTKLSFASFRLAKHPLPFWSNNGNAEAEKELAGELSRIRQSIGKAVEEVPWRFRIWQAVIIAATRVVSVDRQTAEISKAMEWLETVLRPIAVGGPWEQNFPGSKASGKNQAQRDRLAVAFLRATFWRAWSQAVRSLAFARPGADAGDGIKRWSTSHWGWFVLPEGRLTEIYGALSNLERWTEILYPNARTLDLTDFEKQALVEATLSTCKWLDFKVDEAGSPGVGLRLPKSIWSEAPEAVRRALGPGASGATSIIALLSLSQRPERLYKGFASQIWRRIVPNFDSAPNAFIKLESIGLLDRSLDDEFREMADLACAGLARTSTAWLAHYYQVVRGQCLSHDYIPISIERTARKLFPGWMPLRSGSDLFVLLWGSEGSFAAQPARTPGLGLPPGIVLSMLREATINPDQKSPRSWALTSDSERFLFWGRANQVGNRSMRSPHVGRGFVLPIQQSSLPPHPAFLLSPRRSWANGLLALTALTGKEALLDKIWSFGRAPIDFQERYAWRSQALAPLEFWRALDAALFEDESDVAMLRLVAYVDEKVLPDSNGIDRQRHCEDLFRVSRIDIDLRSGEFKEEPMSARPKDAPEDEAFVGDSEEFTVRVAQLTETVSKQEVIRFDFPRLSQQTTLRLLRQFIEALPDRNQLDRSEGRPEIIIGPEIFLPAERGVLKLLERCARKRNLAILVGLFWQEIQFGIRPARSLSLAKRYFVNEALLLAPVSHKANARPYLVREFRIQKPLPASIEHGLADALTEYHHDKGSSVRWSIVPGTRWFCFQHASWGRFAVAICSDLLDPLPWASMARRFQHLFMVAYNTDVDLYQALTWTRAYECYSNLVAVNHGDQGGSFCWTPKHQNQKEVAILRGGRLKVIVDIRLETRALWEQQKNGWKVSVERLKKWWLDGKTDPKPDSWKTPPYTNR